MNHRIAARAAIAAASAAALIRLIGAAAEAPTQPDPAVAATMARIRDAAMGSAWSWQRLEELTDHIGPRLSGSPQHAAAIAQLAGAMRALGGEVRLQTGKVPHWVRGEEHAELIDYPGRPAGVTQSLHLTALGSSSAT